MKFQTAFLFFNVIQKGGANARRSEFFFNEETLNIITVKPYKAGNNAVFS